MLSSGVATGFVAYPVSCLGTFGGTCSLRGDGLLSSSSLSLHQCYNAEIEEVETDFVKESEAKFCVEGFHRHIV